MLIFLFTILTLLGAYGWQRRRHRHLLTAMIEYLQQKLSFLDSARDREMFSWVLAEELGLQLLSVNDPVKQRRIDFGSPAEPAPNPGAEKLLWLRTRRGHPLAVRYTVREGRVDPSGVLRQLFAEF